MKKIEKHCSVCDGKREFKRIGFLPVQFTQEKAESKWENTEMCTDCGSIIPVEVEVEDVLSAHQRYLRQLLAEDVVEKEEIQDKLQ